MDSKYIHCLYPSVSLRSFPVQFTIVELFQSCKNHIGSWPKKHHFQALLVGLFHPLVRQLSHEPKRTTLTWENWPIILYVVMRVILISSSFFKLCHAVKFSLLKLLYLSSIFMCNQGLLLSFHSAAILSENVFLRGLIFSTRALKTHCTFPAQRRQSYRNLVSVLELDIQIIYHGLSLLMFPLKPHSHANSNQKLHVSLVISYIDLHCTCMLNHAKGTNFVIFQINCIKRTTGYCFLIFLSILNESQP